MGREHQHSGISSVTELNSANGSILRVINSKADGFNSIRGIAVAKSHVWVTNGGFSATELNVSDPSLVRVIR